MKNIMNITTLLLLLSISLFSSQINLIEPKEALRLIGNKKVVFVSGDSYSRFTKEHIVGSINMYAYDLHYKGEKPLYSCRDRAMEYIGAKGITEEKLIIAYDTLYGYNAMGVYSFFKILGYRDIKVLDGDLESIRALDPNQKVFNKIHQELESTKRELKLTKDRLKIKKLKEHISSLNAKIDILKPQLLIESN